MPALTLIRVAGGEVNHEITALAASISTGEPELFHVLGLIWSATHLGYLAFTAFVSKSALFEDNVHSLCSVKMNEVR